MKLKRCWNVVEAQQEMWNPGLISGSRMDWNIPYSPSIFAKMHLFVLQIVETFRTVWFLEPWIVPCVVSWLLVVSSVNVSRKCVLELKNFITDLFACRKLTCACAFLLFVLRCDFVELLLYSLTVVKIFNKDLLSDCSVCAFIDTVTLCRETVVFMTYWNVPLTFHCFENLAVSPCHPETCPRSWTEEVSDLGSGLFSFLVLCSPKVFLIPWTGGAFAPLGPFLCPTTEEKKWPIAPKPYDLYWVNEFNIENKFKKQNLLVSILKLMLCLNV